MRSFWEFIKVMVGVKPVEDEAPLYLAGPLRGRTRKEQVLSELRRATGTGRQLSNRMNLKLSIVRVTLTSLHKEGLIRDTGKNTGEGRESENIWEVVAIPTWELVDERGPLDVDTVKKVRGV
tara:strand:- start:109 stop:474 length:366 start_codon:yes stop_codon:yes gene_type:complete